MNGELIGINVAVVQNSQSIGFAVPVEKVKEAINDHTQNEGVAIKRRAALGQKLKQADLQEIGEDSWNPFSEIQKIKEEMDQMFRKSFSGRGNKRGLGMFNTDISYDADFDLKERKDHYLLTFDIRDLDKDKIDIEINDRSITISGVASSQTKEDGQGSSFSSQSFPLLYEDHSIAG